MTLLTRYQPRSLRWDNLWDTSTLWNPTWSTPTWEGAIDTYETKDAVVVEINMPGVQPEQVSVEEREGRLVVRVEQTDERREERFGRQLQARMVHVWERSILLPADVDASRAEATLQNGVLTVRLPRSDSGRVRRIPVNGTKGRGSSSTSRPRWWDRLGQWLHWTRSASS